MKGKSKKAHENELSSTPTTDRDSSMHFFYKKKYFI